MNNNKVYKIRNKDGEYKNTGLRDFGSEGKTFTTLRRCKGHLSLYKCLNWETKETFYDIPEDWVVEEYILIKVNEYNAKELMEKKNG